MPFILLRGHFSPTLDFMLAQSPNGTPLAFAQAIWTRQLRELRHLLRLYWMEDGLATPDRIQLLEGVDTCEVLEQVPVTINDPQWQFNDDYIDSIFLPLVLKGVH